MSTDSKLSKLWKTEDWLACWLGFIVIAIYMAMFDMYAVM